MDKLTLNSYAKLNLYLEVINRRKDGYHNIKTLFERISLFDRLTFKARGDERITVSSNSPDVPLDDSNLAYRAARLLQESLGVHKGVDIRIFKRIPVASGMGGGSSNAAYTLLGLNKLWGLNLTRKKLVSFAGKLGSDVPFFIYDRPFALGSLRGEKIKPVESLRGLRLWHILVVPKIRVRTPMIYSEWDKFSALTRQRYDVNILVSALKKNDSGLVAHTLFNSLEKITTDLYPELKVVREKLKLSGLSSILMSGSGPAIYGVSFSKKEAISIYGKLKDKMSCRVFFARTL